MCFVCTTNTNNGCGCNAQNSCQNSCCWNVLQICRDCNGNIRVRSGNSGCGYSYGCGWNWNGNTTNNTNSTTNSNSGCGCCCGYNYGCGSYGNSRCGASVSAVGSTSLDSGVYSSSCYGRRRSGCCNAYENSVYND